MFRNKKTRSALKVLRVFGRDDRMRLALQSALLGDRALMRTVPACATR